MYVDLNMVRKIKKNISTYCIMENQPAFKSANDLVELDNNELKK